MEHHSNQVPFPNNIFLESDKKMAACILEVSVESGVGSENLRTSVNNLLRKFGVLILNRLHEYGEVSVFVCEENTMSELNWRFRGKNIVTDVLSFSQNDSVLRPVVANKILGDVVIAYEKAKLQADQHNESIDYELCRLLLHGILHLLGYEHKDPPREEEYMIDLQEDLLKELIVSLDFLEELKGN